MTILALLFIRKIGTQMRFAACCNITLVAIGFDVWIWGSLL